MVRGKVLEVSTGDLELVRHVRERRAERRDLRKGAGGTRGGAVQGRLELGHAVLERGRQRVEVLLRSLALRGLGPAELLQRLRECLRRAFNLLRSLLELRLRWLSRDARPDALKRLLPRGEGRADAVRPLLR